MTEEQFLDFVIEEVARMRSVYESGGTYDIKMTFGLPQSAYNDIQEEIKKYEDKIRAEERRHEFLPPKEQFVNNLQYLLDLAHATPNERKVMGRLIKRFKK